MFSLDFAKYLSYLEVQENSKVDISIIIRERENVISERRKFVLNMLQNHLMGANF